MKCGHDRQTVAQKHDRCRTESSSWLLVSVAVKTRAVAQNRHNDPKDKTEQGKSNTNNAHDQSGSSHCAAVLAGRLNLLLREDRQDDGRWSGNKADVAAKQDE